MRFLTLLCAAAALTACDIEQKVAAPPDNTGGNGTGSGGNGAAVCTRGTPCSGVTFGPFAPADTLVVNGTSYTGQGQETFPVSGLDSSVYASAGACASIGSITITGSGKSWHDAIVINAISVGQCSIILWPAANPAMADTLWLTVVPAQITPQISVVIQPTWPVFHIGANCAATQTYQFLYEVLPVGTSQSVIFSDQGNGVLRLGSGGLISPLKAGTDVVKVAAGVDTAAYATATVTVDNASCESNGTGSTASTVTGSINAPSGTTMHVGSSQQLTVTTNAPDPTVTWSSSQAEFVLVNAQSGIVTAFSAVTSPPGGVASSQVCATLRTNPTNVSPWCITITVIP